MPAAHGADAPTAAIRPRLGYYIPQNLRGTHNNGDVVAQTGTQVAGGAGVEGHGSLCASVCLVLCACSEVRGQAPLVASGRGSTPSVQHGLLALASHGGARLPVDVDAECAPGAGISAGEATGRVVVRFDAPAGVVIDAEVVFVDEPPHGFLAIGDPRTLSGIEAICCWSRDPITAAEATIADDLPVQLDGESVRVEIPVEDLPLGRALWACLVSWGGDDYREPLGYAPQVVELAPLAAHGPGDPTPVVALTLAPYGCIVGRVVGADPAQDADWEDAQESEPEPSLQAPSWPQLDELAVRLRGAGPRASIDDHGRFCLGPLPAGSHELDCIATTDESVQRRIRTALVSNGEATELFTWRLDTPEPAWILLARDEDGDAIEGTFVLELWGYPPVRIDGGELGRAVLRGEWRDCSRIGFEPSAIETFEPSALSAASARGSPLELVCRRRTRPLMRVRLEGQWSRALTWSCMRGSAHEAWRPTFLGSWNGGCVYYASSWFAPGPHEVMAWLPEHHLSYVGPLEVQVDASDAALAALAFTDPATTVRGRLRVTCAGVETSEEVLAWPAARGQPSGIESSRHAEPPHPGRLAPGPFELRGLPPAMDLDLVFHDDELRELARLPVRVERGGTLDLGLVTLDLR